MWEGRGVVSGGGGGGGRGGGSVGRGVVLEGEWIKRGACCWIRVWVVEGRVVG